MQDKVRIRRKPRHDRTVLVSIRRRRQSLRCRLGLRQWCLGGHRLEAAQLDSISYPLIRGGELSNDWSFLSSVRRLGYASRVEVPSHQERGISEFYSILKPSLAAISRCSLCTSNPSSCWDKTGLV